MSATFLFDMFMIIAVPIMGRAMGQSDMAYGLWTGTAVNDTSSVVAAGFAYSDAAGDFATMVKLTITLSIISVVLIFRLIHHRLEVKNGTWICWKEIYAKLNRSIFYTWIFNYGNAKLTRFYIWRIIKQPKRYIEIFDGSSPCCYWFNYQI